MSYRYLKLGSFGAAGPPADTIHSVVGTTVDKTSSSTTSSSMTLPKSGLPGASAITGQGGFIESGSSTCPECPTCSDCPPCSECPTCVECQSCTDQGYIMPDMCAGCESKSDAASGFSWYWLAGAATLGIALGYGVSRMKR
jgi:hypothetical protein